MKTNSWWQGLGAWELENLSALNQDAALFFTLTCYSATFGASLESVSFSRPLFLVLLIVYLSFCINFISDLTTFNLRTTLPIHSDLSKTLSKYICTRKSYVPLIFDYFSQDKNPNPLDRFIRPFSVRPHATFPATPLPQPMQTHFHRVATNP